MTLSLAFFDGFDSYDALTQIGQLWQNWIGFSASYPQSVIPGRLGYGRAIKGVSNLLIPLPPIEESLACGIAMTSTSMSTGAGITFYLNGTKQLEIRVDYPTGLITIRKGGAGTVLATSSIVFPWTSWSYLECAVRIHSSLGQVFVKINGVLDSSLTLTNVNTTDAGALGCNVVLYGGNAVASPTFYIDDIYAKKGSGVVAASDMLGSVRVKIDLPNSDGVDADWVADNASINHYTRVNDATPNDDTSYLTSGGLNSKCLFGFAALPITVETIHGVQLLANMRKTDAKDRIVKLRCVSGASDSLGGELGITSSYLYHRRVIELNPDGSVAWTRATLDAAKFGAQQTNS
jgi:hypothetical protein